MATYKLISPPLSRSEQRFWDQAFLAAQIPTLLKGNGKRAPAYVALIAGEYSTAAVLERRHARNGATR